MNPGKYLFEVYGAQGSQRTNDAGGKGGYAKITDIFLFIGSQGVWTSNSVFSQNSFNGGGRGYNNGPGGGATDFRLSENDLSSRFLIGGGGGAEGYRSSTSFKGGSGGGLSGGDGIVGTDSSATIGRGGSQISGGSGYKNMNGIFGFGANKTETGIISGGGGGGLFGGGTGEGAGCSGGGGSGFVYSNSKPPEIRDINEIMIENGTLIGGVNIGDGYAVISRLLSLSNNICSCHNINAYFYFIFTILSSHQLIVL
ncbi:PE-PGRS protein, putative [Trichomonas vaginalis G3]|uniref:receptor protein-tyrosine kinase n=1 Tax=Trichomonas vaginalis (strain ATCC PRA-98 / G3) TaxID=412133 RepID=A2EM31_TRIV3|nr:glycine-rich protein family [Trichomonas vaginalis G3]EAY06290.1 PE-PGRS protein, putative [Trichomonas vaginalis G3]KAI5503368.1 glycine-rich protein family [Trichomonas vaginalis G3]|eukprot:XP_001318513.1 PE-PGRS protein [Trichomonas vaginalis G3]